MGVALLENTYKYHYYWVNIPAVAAFLLMSVVTTIYLTHGNRWSAARDTWRDADGKHNHAERLCMLMYPQDHIVPLGWASFYRFWSHLSCASFFT